MASYCGARAGLIRRFANKTGVMKGFQKIMVSDVHHIRPSAYRHRYKSHVNPPWRTVWGKIEMKEIMEVLNMMVEREEVGERQILPELPHGSMTSVGIR